MRNFNGNIADDVVRLRKHGLDESSFRCLQRFFFFVCFFFLALESDDDDSDESDDDSSGSRFTSGSWFLPRFEISIDRVIWLLSSRVWSSRVPILSILLSDVSRSKTFLVSDSESLICLRWAIFSLIGTGLDVVAGPIFLRAPCWIRRSRR